MPLCQSESASACLPLLIWPSFGTQPITCISSYFKQWCDFGLMCKARKDLHLTMSLRSNSRTRVFVCVCSGHLQTRVIVSWNFERWWWTHLTCWGGMACLAKQHKTNEQAIRSSNSLARVKYQQINYSLFFDTSSGSQASVAEALTPILERRSRRWRCPSHVYTSSSLAMPLSNAAIWYLSCLSILRAAACSAILQVSCIRQPLGNKWWTSIRRLLEPCDPEGQTRHLRSSKSVPALCKRHLEESAALSGYTSASRSAISTQEHARTDATMLHHSQQEIAHVGNLRLRHLYPQRVSRNTRNADMDSRS